MCKEQSATLCSQANLFSAFNRELKKLHESSLFLLEKNHHLNQSLHQKTKDELSTKETLHSLQVRKGVCLTDLLEKL